MEWSVSYKFLGMICCSILRSKRLIEWLKKNHNAMLDFDNPLPSFKEIYEDDDNKEDIDQIWSKEFIAWPSSNGFPPIVIRTIDQNTEGYILKPDRIVLQWPDGLLKENPELKGQIANYSGDSVEAGDITRAQVNNIHEVLQRALGWIRTGGDLQENYLTDPRALFEKRMPADYPDAEMKTTLGSSEIVFSRTDSKWVIALPTEFEGLGAAVAKHPCSHSCDSN